MVLPFMARLHRHLNSHCIRRAARGKSSLRLLVRLCLRTCLVHPHANVMSCLSADHPTPRTTSHYKELQNTLTNHKNEPPEVVLCPYYTPNQMMQATTALTHQAPLLRFQMKTAEATAHVTAPSVR